MAINVVRFTQDGKPPAWGVVQDRYVAVLEIRAATTAELIESGAVNPQSPPPRGSLPVKDLRLLSPVTAPCRVVCNGANYRRHMIESGLDPDQKDFNIFFTKSDASITSAHASVQRPAHVKLLDYEIEMTLVTRNSVQAAVTVTRENIHEHVAALAIANDLSARDVQLPQSQWFKGKSYRGFCPVGPHLAFLAREDYAYLDALQLTLQVNGEVRQHDSTANLVFKPWETLTELSAFSDWSPGDLILTGTPAGCALRAPPGLVQKIGALIPEKTKWQFFVKGQLKSSKYLKPGDVVTAMIASTDRAIDLGEQRVTITG